MHRRDMVHVYNPLTFFIPAFFVGVFIGISSFADVFLTFFRAHPVEVLACVMVVITVVFVIMISDLHRDHLFAAERPNSPVYLPPQFNAIAVSIGGLLLGIAPGWAFYPPISGVFGTAFGWIRPENVFAIIAVAIYVGFLRLQAVKRLPRMHWHLSLRRPFLVRSTRYDNN